jgi:hypothetical protein
MLWGRDIGQKPYQYGQKELETMRENCKTLTYKEIAEMFAGQEFSQAWEAEQFEQNPEIVG